MSCLRRKTETGEGKNSGGHGCCFTSMVRGGLSDLLTFEFKREEGKGENYAGMMHFDSRKRDQ